ncbi:MAG: MarR family transcriptional regulator [Clostridia bacterium]|nr:MarR family transcriptional regulator [Clostridia bacterium]MBQ3058108.1 MarR family transcriptional regulator [Clostridia bacterium]
MQHEKNIGFNIRRLSNYIRRDIEKSSASGKIVLPKGVNGWAINYFYDNRDKEVFQRDFENRFSIRRSTASNILKTMEQNGFIQRVRVEGDARLKRIILTDKAIKIHEEIMRDIKRRELKLRKGISEEEIDQFLSMVNRFIANLEDEND